MLRSKHSINDRDPFTGMHNALAEGRRRAEAVFRLGIATRCSQTVPRGGADAGSKPNIPRRELTATTLLAKRSPTRKNE